MGFRVERRFLAGRPRWNEHQKFMKQGCSVVCPLKLFRRRPTARYLAILDIALAFIKGGLSEGFDMSALKNVLRALLSDGTCCDFLAFRLTLRQVFKKTALFDNAVQRLLQGIRV